MIGRTISHYKITEKLGEGGMGVVYKAEDTKLDRFVALNEGPTVSIARPKAAAALSHSNVATVYEVGEEKGRTFIAMEFVEGQSLDKLIEKGPLEIEDALHIAIQSALALTAVHENSIVHRDSQASNILVTGPRTGREMVAVGHSISQYLEAGLTKKDHRSRKRRADKRRADRCSTAVARLCC